jgi:hypothetical protein
MDVVATHARIETHLAQMSTSVAATSGPAHDQLAATLAYVGSIDAALDPPIAYLAGSTGQ